MDYLTKCAPQRVFYYFEQLSRIPRGSGNMAGVSAYCLQFAQAHGLDATRDKQDNVIIRKPASPGHEAADPVILQGHLDMVCEKLPGSDFDFTKDPLHLQLEGDWLTADGTTLGADNGIAIAMILAILEDTTLAHPALEAVFTTDEETGLFGAAALDTSCLQGKTLINLDSEDEGVLTVSCAGGIRVTGALPVRRTHCTLPGLRITVGGLRGGHSGAQIHEGRGSAIQLLARLLLHCSAAAPFALVGLDGGGRDNVIAAHATATLTAEPDALAAIQQAAAQLQAAYQAELVTTDPGITVTVDALPAEKRSALTLEDTRRAVQLLASCPQGVIAMSQDLPGLVQTSLNLGILQLSGEQLQVDFSVRSSCESQKDMLVARLGALFGLAGGEIHTHGNYPGWAFLRHSPLRDHMVETWQQMFGAAPKVEAIHAGLECGLFAGKIPGLDAVSLGPQMQEVHTVNERLSIASTQRVYRYVCQVLATWGTQKEEL